MLFCGIDIGSTNLKVLLATQNGHTVWSETVPTPRLQEKPFSTNLSGVLVCIEDLIIKGWKAVGKKHKIAAISTTGVGEDGVYVNEELQPLAYALAWFDDCAVEEAKTIQNSDVATPTTGILMDHTRTGAKWLWCARHTPEIVKKAHCWISMTDYPLCVWTKTPFMSETLASRTGCYNVLEHEWNKPLLKYCHAPVLPKVLRAGEVVGPMASEKLLKSGAVDENTLIVAGGHDHPVAASFIYTIQPNVRVDSIGTANVIYGESQLKSLDVFDPYIAFMTPMYKKTGVACLGVYEFSASVNKLAAQGFDIRKFLQSVRIKGKPTPSSVLNKKECTPRALLELATLNARLMLDRICNYGVERTPIYATGGWSRSRSLIELRASVYNEPIHIINEKEPAVVGAALLAARAINKQINFNASIVTTIIDPVKKWSKYYDDYYTNEFIKLAH